LPKPLNNDANTAYGFSYSALSSAVMPIGLPNPAEDEEIVEQLLEALTDPNESYEGVATYFQTISDLTNKHYRFNSLMAPSDVYFDFAGYNFAEGQPVRVIKRIDQYAQQGWDGDVKAHLVEIEGDVYAQSVE